MYHLSKLSCRNGTVLNSLQTSAGADDESDEFPVMRCPVRNSKPDQDIFLRDDLNIKKRRKGGVSGVTRHNATNRNALQVGIQGLFSKRID
jgi:hypothetical protein